MYRTQRDTSFDVWFTNPISRATNYLVRSQIISFCLALGSNDFMTSFDKYELLIILDVQCVQCTTPLLLPIMIFQSNKLHCSSNFFLNNIYDKFWKYIEIWLARHIYSKMNQGKVAQFPLKPKSSSYLWTKHRYPVKERSSAGVSLIMSYIFIVFKWF